MQKRTHQTNMEKFEADQANKFLELEDLYKSKLTVEYDKVGLDYSKFWGKITEYTQMEFFGQNLSSSNYNRVILNSKEI